MSTRRVLGRALCRRHIFGSTVIVAVAVGAVLALGAASSAAHHRAGGASAVRNAMSSTHVSSRAQRHASVVSRVSRHSVENARSSSGSGSNSSLLRNFSLISTPRSLASVVCGTSNSIAANTAFEDADGNLNVDTAGCTDWNSFNPTWSGNTGTATLGGLSFIGLTDPTNSSSDSIYSGGVKQDTTCPAVTTGNVNDKADLGRIYIATETVGGHVYLFLAWERQIDNTINSDVFVSFEFNQGKLACTTNTDGFVQRTKGDLLFDYNFQSGNSTIDANQWDGSTWQALPTPPFEAAVNAGTVTDSIGPSGSVSLTTFEFGEAGIDLSALNLTGNGGKACETFGSVLGGSRTSKSGDNAQLKDYVGPAPIDVSNCVQPTVTTTLKNAADNSTIANNSSVALGSSVYDTAVLGNLTSGKVPTGTVAYTFFTNGTCNGTGTSAGTVTLSNGLAAHSNTEGPLQAGNYSFEAQYSAGNDQNYTDSAPSSCEPFAVAKADSATATVVKDGAGHTVDQADPAALGSKVHDTATVTAAPFTATGTVTYQLYSGLDCKAGNELGSAGQVTMSGGNVPASVDSPVLQAGDYSYQAVYSGDSNYNGSTGDCEPFAVAKAPTSSATIVFDAATNDAWSGSEATGSSAYDTATVSGQQ
jgi:hypothetical protein